MKSLYVKTCIGALVCYGLPALCSQSNGAPVPSVPYTWKHVQIVGGGFVPGIEFSPCKSGLMYCRTDMGGAYRWDNSAKRWIALTDFAGGNEDYMLGIESIAPDPHNPNRVYAAVGTYTGPGQPDGAILRSNDMGSHWKITRMPFKMGGNQDGRSIGERLDIDPNDTHILYFGSRQDGLWRSSDRGAMWSKVSSFPVQESANGIGIGFIVFDPYSGSKGTPSKTIYVGCDSGDIPLYKSTDGGATWSAVPGQPLNLMPQHGVLSSSGILYLTYGNAPGPNGVTGGAVWKLNTTTGSWKDISPISSGFAGLSIDAEHPDTIMVSTLDHWSGGDQIFRSLDGGSTWESIFPNSTRDASLSPFLLWGKKSASPGWWLGSVEIDPFHPGHVLYGTGATIWASDDVTGADSGQPTHWFVGAEGIEETAVLKLISPPAGAHLISGLGDICGFKHNDFNRSPRAGMMQNPIFTTTTGLDYAALKPMWIVRSGDGARNQPGAYSSDGGTTWTPFPTAPEGFGGGSIAISSNAKTIIWNRSRGSASYSTDLGRTWTACSGCPAHSEVISDRVDPLKFYSVGPASDGSGNVVYSSSDAGKSFAAVTTLPFNEYGNLVAVPGHANDIWLVSSHSGLYHSVNGGLSFHQNQTVSKCMALGFGKHAPNETYPAMYITGVIKGVMGIFRSDDEGSSWVRINDHAHRYGYIQYSITGDPRIYGRVYLGTNGRGIPYGDPTK